MVSPLRSAASSALFEAKLAASRLRWLGARARGGRLDLTVPGTTVLRLAPGAVGRLSRRLTAGSVVVSGTNGKTTTAAMVAEILRASGRRPVHNRAGINMRPGVAAALVTASRVGGRVVGDVGVFEIDERWLSSLVADLRPTVVVLTNLFRDQLDRHGELDDLANRWAALLADLPDGVRVAMCADDPLLADLGRGRPGVVWFGMGDASLSIPELPVAADSIRCRRCGNPLSYRTIHLGHLGDHACAACGLDRPPLAVAAGAVEPGGLRGSRMVLTTPEGEAAVHLSLPGAHNVYNALAAAAAGVALGLPLAHVVAGLEQSAPVFGRAERLRVGGRALVMLLVKNPTGADVVVRTALLEPGPLDLLVALNDGLLDGRDVSWIWDADLESLAGRVGHATCAGARAEEMALRLKYAGIEPERIDVVPDLAVALDHALRAAALEPANATGEADGVLMVLPNYTAMVELREILTERHGAPRYWT